MKKVKKRRKRRNNKRLIIIIMFSLLLLSLIAFSFFRFMKLRERTVLIYDNYFSNDTINLIIDDNFVKNEDYEEVENENLIITENDDMYLHFGVVRDYIDEFIYWDETLNKVIYTNLVDTITFDQEENYYYFNDEKKSYDAPIKYVNNYPYIKDEVLIQLYGIDINYIEDTNSIIIDTYTNFDAGLAVVESGMFEYLQYEPTAESKYALPLKKNEEVLVYDKGIDYTRVRMENGAIGYIENTNLKTIESPIDKEEEQFIIPDRDDKVVLLWDQVTTVQANSNANRRVTHDGVNVLSPTWFTFNERTLDGEIVSIADKDYVDFAHDNGYEVWALLTDIPKGNVDNVGNIANQVLTNTDKRLKAKDELMNYLREYDLDGLNLDFEYIRQSDIDDYIQFVRELYTDMRREGYILSVDTYVPSAWSMYYNREALAKSSDYIAVMTYDEHTSASEENGPVASYGFVDKGVKDSLEEIPEEKLLMGIPFYTRVWKTETVDGEEKRTVRNFSMVSAVDFFEKNDAVIQWDEETGYYHAEFTSEENGSPVHYEAWLETVETIEKKLEIFEEYDIAGIAMWKRGLEDPKVWNLIGEINK